MGDERPPRQIGPRATREMRRLAPQDQKPGNPIDGMLGCLMAGAWCFAFVYWLRLSGIVLLLVCGLGFILMTFGLILLGLSIGEALGGRHRHG